MALNIKDSEADRLAPLTGESIAVAIKTAVRQRIDREERERSKASVEELMAIARRTASRATTSPEPTSPQWSGDGAGDV